MLLSEQLLVVPASEHVHPEALKQHVIRAHDRRRQVPDGLRVHPQETRHVLQGAHHMMDVHQKAHAGAQGAHLLISIATSIAPVTSIPAVASVAAVASITTVSTISAISSVAVVSAAVAPIGTVSAARTPVGRPRKTARPRPPVASVGRRSRSALALGRGLRVLGRRGHLNFPRFPRRARLRRHFLAAAWNDGRGLAERPRLRSARFWSPRPSNTARSADSSPVTEGAGARKNVEF
eukprot:scaffold1355_cov268-Pinguiococcus_pyrenoidosus.AAC.18